MGYRQSPLIHNKERIYLHKSEDIDVYTEYILGEVSYRYQNDIAADTFIVLEGSIELTIEGSISPFHKGGVIDIDKGTHHGPISSRDGAMLLVIHRRK